MDQQADKLRYAVQLLDAVLANTLTMSVYFTRKDLLEARKQVEEVRQALQGDYQAPELRG